jgi:hypothetical protein
MSAMNLPALHRARQKKLCSPVPSLAWFGSQPVNTVSMLKKLTFLLLLAALVSSCSNDHVNESGGAYGYSADGKWLAEISDGHSTTHNLPYAVVRLWDLKKYPSLKKGTRWDTGKAPTARFEFPQKFDARDPQCGVSWETNSLSFSIKFSAVSGSSTSATPSLRRFRYDLLTDTFSMGTAE